MLAFLSKHVLLLSSHVEPENDVIESDSYPCTPTEMEMENPQFNHLPSKYEARINLL